jgi:hypothetical protein
MTKKLTATFNDSAPRATETLLGASLNFLAADTRQGLDAQAQADFAVIKKHADNNPRRAAYVERIEASARGPVGAAVSHTASAMKM